MKQFLKFCFKKTKLIAAFLTIAFSIQSNAQELFYLSGKVVDGLNPVSGASVIIKGTTKGTTTGPDGNFSFQLKILK